MLAVVIFHAFPKHLSGGFAGVDVFFVISGFLITCIIDKGLKRGDFEFSDFWARRIRRIFPALLTVTITTLIAGWWYLLPAEFENLKSHIKWGLAFAANFKLNSEVGYFDVAAELKPQLHLWSLAIEEQFYLFWPALLWICFRQRINPFTATLLLGYYSYQSRKFFSTTASESFYFPWTRFWELQAGALLAFWNADYAQRFSELWNRFEKYIRPLVLSTTASNDGHTTTELFKSVMSFTGISLVAWSCFSFTKATPFPSRSTLYPVLGAVLIIAAGKDAWFNRWILSLRPLRFVGKISFPLYLWHWPILSFVRIILGEPNFKVALCAVGLSFALSIFTYFFIEQRLRFDIGRVAWKAPTLTAALCGLILVLKLLNIKSANTLKSNLGTIINGPSEAIFAPCPKSLTKEGPQALGYCAQTRTVPKPSIAIIGDSHAHHLMHGFSKLSPENILLVGHSSCPPVLTKQFYTPHCVLKNRAILDYMESNEGESVQTVVLSFFGWYAAQNPHASQHVAPGAWNAVTINGSSDSDVKLPAFESGLSQFASELTNNGKAVFIVEDIPEMPFMPEPCLSTVPAREALKSLLGLRAVCSVTKASYESRQNIIKPMFLRIAAQNKKIRIVSAALPLCNDASCSMMPDGQLLYSDSHHLNMFGSEIVARSLLEQISEQQTLKLEISTQQ